MPSASSKTCRSVARALPASGAPSEVQAGRESLASARALLDPYLREAVERIPRSVQPIAGYHLGWLDEHGHVVNAHPGKAIRPALAFLAAEAVGGVAEAALPAAAAIELVHNFSLMHDDVIDNDDTRRHRHTAWRVFGVGPALLAGNALLALAYDVLAADGGPAAAAPAADMLNAAVLAVVDGQARDLAFERRTDVSLAECMAMVQQKTAFLMGCACALGALFGGGDQSQIDELRSFGKHLGFAFQLVDDLLGVWGDPAVTGKPAGSDLQSRKKSLPVVAALTSGTAAGHELAALYAHSRPLVEADLVAAAEWIDGAGARLWAEAQIEVLVSRALHDLESARLCPPAGDQLRSVARLISRQDRRSG